MIIHQGAKVTLGGDASGFLGALDKGKVGAVAFAAAATAALVGVTKESARMAAQLDRDLNMVASLGGEAAQGTGRLRSEIKQLGREFGRDFRTLAQANYQAVSAGFKSINDSMAVTRAGTRLAVAGNADLVGSTELVAKVYKAFGAELDSYEEAAAAAWGITRDGIVTVEGLNRFMQDLPSTAALSGLRISELGGAVSTLTSVTGHASSAVDQLRSLLIKLEQAGITGTLVERMERLAGKGIGELTRLLGDQTAARGALVLANNLNTLRANTEAATEVTGDFDTAVDTLNNDALSETAKLQQEWNALLDEAGQLILPGVVELVGQLAGVLGEVNEELDGTRSKMGPVTPETLLRVPPEMRQSATGTRLGDFFLAGGDMGFGQGNAPAPPSTEAASASVTMARVNAEMDPGLLNYLQDGQRAWDEYIEVFQMGEEATAHMADEVDRASRANQRATAGQQFATAATFTLANTLTNQFVNALGLGDSALGQFVGTMLSFAANLGAGALLGGFNIPGFSSGGFTGSRGGMVHANEFVFDADAVNKIGLGRLERMHRMAGGGGSFTLAPTINVSGGGDAQATAAVTSRAVLSALREARLSGEFREFADFNMGGA